MKKCWNAEEAVEQLARPLGRFVRYLCADPERAADLTQESLLRVAESIDSFECQSNLQTWAFTIARRVVADYFRASKHAAAMVPIETEPEALDEESDLESRVIVDEMGACVQDVIGRLPEDHRVALILRDLEGFSVAEVAKIAECTLATAKIRVHRARRQLQQALGRECEFYKSSENVLRCERR
ncbi:MAG: RNA polymerase sigma factor [Gammaproteobacteria bacterium]